VNGFGRFAPKGRFFLSFTGPFCEAPHGTFAGDFRLQPSYLPEPDHIFGFAPVFCLFKISLVFQ
jgi:hypothetical protein